MTASLFRALAAIALACFVTPPLLILLFVRRLRVCQECRQTYLRSDTVPLPDSVHCPHCLARLEVA